jgi:hypothetical protein
MSEPTIPGPPGLPGETPFPLLLDEAMRWTRRHFRAIYPATALPIALLSAGTVAGQALLGPPGAAVAADPFAPLAYLGRYFLLVSPLLFGTWLAQLALQVGTVDAAAGRMVDMRRAWRFVVRPRVLGTAILRGLALLVSLLTCVCLVPSVLYVLSIFAFTMPVMVEERIYLVAALRRSVELAHYNPRRRFLSLPWVKVVAVVLVGFLLQTLASVIVGLPVNAGQMVSIFRRAAANEPMRSPGALLLWGQVATQIVAALINTAISLYAVFVISLLYFDLRRRREGADLEQAIAGLAPPAGGPPVAPPSAPTRP